MSLVAASSLGKWPRTRTALADLRVKALNRIGGVKDFAQLRCEGEERNDLFPIAPPALRDGRIFLPPGATVEFFQPLPRHRGRCGLIDRFERQRHRPAFLPRGEVHRVTDEMQRVSEISCS